MVWLVLLSLGISAMFTMAVAGKLFDFVGFRRVLQYTLGLDRKRAAVVGICVVASECLAATTGLAKAIWRPWLYFDLFVGGVLMVAFIGWAGMIISRHLVISCPCFGQPGASVSWRTLLRNTSLLGVTVATALIAVRRPSQDVAAIRQAILAGAVFAVACGVAAYRFAQPHLLTVHKVRALLDGEGSD